MLSAGELKAMRSAAVECAEAWAPITRDLTRCLDEIERLRGENWGILEGAQTWEQRAKDAEAKLAEAERTGNQALDHWAKQAFENLTRAEKAEAAAAVARAERDRACEACERMKLGVERHVYDEARAEAAALREALDDIAFWRCGCGATWASDKAKQALSQPGPGAALLERKRKLEALAEAAASWVHAAKSEPKCVEEAYSWGNECMDAADATVKALAALEEKP